MRKGSVSYDDFLRVVIAAKRLPKFLVTPCLNVQQGVAQFLSMQGTGVMEVSLHPTDYNQFKQILTGLEKGHDALASRIN